MKIKKELLAPAGDFETLKQAIHNGCDAVYLGGKNSVQDHSLQTSTRKN